MTTRILEAVNALVTLARTAMTGQSVAVWDGPVPTDDVTDFLAIGYDGDPESQVEALTVGREWAGLGAKRLAEAIDVTCSLYTLDGSDSPGAAARTRARLFALFALYDAAVLANPGLGLSAPLTTRLTAPRLLLDAGAAGLEARLVFGVHIDTRTTAG